MADHDYKPLTLGERAVWAAEFVRALDEHGKGSVAVARACGAVCIARQALSKADNLSVEARAMLDDMLAPDAGLFCADGARGTFAPGKTPCSRCGRPAVEHRAR